MTLWLEKYWQNLASNYMDVLTMNSYWKEIVINYSAKSRHYHDLNHLYNMFLQLEEIKKEIHDLDNLKFAIWYHDIIYKSSKNDNEEKSAIFAQKRLKNINFEDKRLEIVQKLIISTKKHELILTNNKDNAYLLDLDLSILGTDWKTYQIYIQNIRKEYKIYPGFMYKPGRKKVLHHFLERETLYFTDTFKNKHEEQARLNIEKEINLL
ncbi:HD domain-containing protein [Lacinutrix cladophorae]